LRRPLIPYLKLFCFIVVIFMQQTNSLTEKIATYENHFKYFIYDDHFIFKCTKYPYF
jgi:hypothetical protein